MALGMSGRYPRILSAMPEPAGVYVLGMHRSGTSATARVVDLLGVPLAREGLLDPSEANPAGYWESSGLMAFNDALLGELGGTWKAPPPIELTAHAGHILRARIPAARALFRALHPTAQWVWKDPRNCILLPFWRAALDERAVAILTLRRPAEIVASVGRRGYWPPERVLRMWEQYTRSALFASRDLPRIVVDYGSLAEHPEREVRRIAAFLEAEGLSLAGEKGVSAAVASVDHELHRERPDDDAVALSAAQQELLASLVAVG
jgi:hypothetical protein